MKKDVYYFHIYLVGGGRAINFYDLSSRKVSELMRKIEKAGISSFVKLPTRDQEDLPRETFVLKSNIAYFEYYRKENNDS